MKSTSNLELALGPRGQCCCQHIVHGILIHIGWGEKVGSKHYWMYQLIVLLDCQRVSCHIFQITSNGERNSLTYTPLGNL